MVEKCEEQEDFSEKKEVHEKGKIDADEIHQMVSIGKHSKSKLMHRVNPADIKGVNKFYLLWKHNGSVHKKYFVKDFQLLTSDTLGFRKFVSIYGENLYLKRAGWLDIYNEAWSQFVNWEWI